MKIVFFTFPFAGHIQPNLNLLLELLKKKSELVIFGSEEYLSKYLSKEKVKYFSYPDYILDACKINTDLSLTTNEAAINYYSYYYDEIRSQKREYYVSEITNKFFIDNYNDLKSFNPDVIFFDFNAFFVRKIMAKLDAKNIEINCNSCDPKEVIKSKSWIRFLNNIVVNQVEEAPSIDEIINVNRKINRLYQKLAYANEMINIKKISCSYHCEELQDEPELVSRGNTYLGFNLPKYKDTEKDGSIYISRGTMCDTFGVNMLHKTLKSLENIDRKIIATLGNNKLAQELINKDTCPNNVEVNLYTNQNEFLSKAAIFITHGGITGVREALINNTPMIVIPVNFNDYQVGKALERSNAGILIETRPLDSKEIEDKVKYMLDNIEKYNDGVKYISNKLREQWENFGVNHLIKEIGL